MLQPSDLRKMDAATSENPVFLTGAVGKWDYSGDDTELSYSGITAVTGRAEDEDHHGNPEYDEIKGTERTFDLSGAMLKDGSPINSLEAAQCWMLENHEPLYMGMSAHQKCPGGDFMFGAVPSAYPEGYRETYENRRMYAQQDAERFGVMLSEENAHDILRDLHAQKADEQHQQTEALKPRPERRLPDISGIDNGPDVNGPEY